MAHPIFPAPPTDSGVVAVSHDLFGVSCRIRYRGGRGRDLRVVRLEALGVPQGPAREEEPRRRSQPPRSPPAPASAGGCCPRKRCCWLASLTVVTGSR